MSGDQRYLLRDSSRISACIYLEVALYVRPFVHPSIRAYSPACLCRCPGPVHRWDRTECCGGRSSKRPTQFQAGSQLLLVLRRSAENERRTSGVCVVWRRSARLYPWSGPLVIRVVPCSWVARGTNVISAISDKVLIRAGSKDRVVSSDPGYMYVYIRQCETA